MRRNGTPGRIVTNCCTGVGVHDVITCADLYYDRLRGLGVAGAQILGFSIDLLRRPYNTLALPCECVCKAQSKVTHIKLEVMIIFLLFYMCHFPIGLTHSYKTTFFKRLTLR